MKVQWHPARGTRPVVSIELEAPRQRAVAAAAGVLAVFLLAFPLSFSAVLAHWRRWAAGEEAALLNARRREALEVATSGLRETDERLETDRDLLIRIAFLYDLPAVLNAADPLAGSPSNPEDRLVNTERKLVALSQSVAAVAQAESENPTWPSLTPSISPVAEASSVVADGFGWRTSRLTGESEFSTGADIAAPEGSAVFATADGVVRWAGSFPLRMNSPYGHLGKIVAIKNGDRAVTIFGNLDAVAVKRGARVRRGEKVGTVGQNRWAGAPRLRYEVWKLGGAEPVPIDPAIAMLNLRPPNVPAILRKAMFETSSSRYAPLPLEFR
jgi:murein DD-endopeptidase MepM/ murein hydrolase activator NlpD